MPRARGARLHVSGGEGSAGVRWPRTGASSSSTYQDGDAAVSGTSTEELLDFHLQAQHPVVTLAARPIARVDARILEPRRHPDTDTLLPAVWWAASPRATGVWS